MGGKSRERGWILDVGGVGVGESLPGWFGVVGA